MVGDGEVVVDNRWEEIDVVRIIGRLMFECFEFGFEL